MAIRIVNQSSIPISKIERIIKFCKLRSSNLTIFVRNSKKYFYGYYIPTKENHIVIGVGSAAHFPAYMERHEKFIKLGYASNFLLKSQEDLLTYLLSHEWKHYHQKINPFFKRKGIKKNRYSESDAEYYALKKLRRWQEYKKLKNDYRKRRRLNRLVQK